VFNFTQQFVNCLAITFGIYSHVVGDWPLSTNCIITQKKYKFIGRTRRVVDDTVINIGYFMNSIAITDEIKNTMFNILIGIHGYIWSMRQKFVLALLNSIEFILFKIIARKCSNSKESLVRRMRTMILMERSGIGETGC
jgi:hypothetical protein